VNRKGPGPTAGSIPRFANTGATSRLYYIVPKSSTLGAGPILLAGYALHNGAGTGNVYWPEVSEDGAGTVTYDVLYQTAGLGANATIAPYLGNATSLTLGTTGSCVNSICTFADNLGAGSAYTVTGQAWMPNLWFWPSGVVMMLEANRATSFGVNLRLHTDQISFPMVSVAGATFPSVESTTCDTNGSWSPINISCFAEPKDSSTIGTERTQGCAKIALAQLLGCDFEAVELSVLIHARKEVDAGIIVL
jgi:hypothetical protein